MPTRNCGSRQQTHGDALFEPAHCMTERRPRDADSLGRTRRASLFREGEKGGQHVQIVVGVR